jgi:hypothetical protein
MYIESIFFPPALPIFLAQFALQIDTLGPFFSVRALHFFSLFFTLAEINPFICDTYEKWVGVAPFRHIGFMFHSKSATIRMTVPAVLSSFLVLTAWRSSLRLTAWRSSLTMSLSLSEFPHGL